jgi:exonuclease VII large subunit
MERGYGILLNSEGKSVNSVMTLQTGEAVSFILKDGNAEAEIKSIKEKNHG